MLEEEKARGRAIAHLPSAKRNALIARMMLGGSAAQARTAFLVLMGAWGVIPPPPPWLQRIVGPRPPRRPGA
ncbi:MAG TPA: hypothetical protein PLJ35_12270 [Anaerolineae bacterium]|nr:hypothetical protein [Anaerolineae bacterium]HOQ99588.1 hypothetical protein [Anaerolineae bacterium]HPL28782.1 hypothetical protein [Anaerolineae bacterium]